MDCREVYNKMFDYIEHQLSQQEIKEFEEHMKDCKSCQDEYYKLEKLIVKLKNIKDVEPPSDLKYKILENIKNEKNEKASIFNFKKYSYIAATMILFVGGFYILKAIENSPVKNNIYSISNIDNYTTTENNIIIEENTETTSQNITETTSIAEKETKTIPQKKEIVTETTTFEEVQTKVESKQVILQQEPLNEELTTNDLKDNKEINKDTNIARATLNDSNQDLKIKEEEIFNNSRTLQSNVGNNFYYEKTILKDNNTEIFKYDIALYKNQICNVYFENNSDENVSLYIENIDGNKVSQDTIVEKNSNNSMQFYMTEEEIEQDVYTINVKAEDKNFIDGYLKIEILPKEN